DPDVNLLKEDVVNVSVWVKLHGVPVTVFSDDGLSVIAIKLGSYVAKKSKIPIQAPRGVPVGPKVGFELLKKLYRPVSKKHNVNTSGNKKKDVESTKEVCNSNLFDVLNSVKNYVDLGTNWENSNLASKEASSSGSSFWNARSSSISTTLVVDKIDKIEKLIFDEK
nr:hypothetical protein [Tanacetum cinerariifolium]